MHSLQCYLCNKIQPMNIRNNIINNIDHGKTTVTDKMIYACKAIDDRKD